MFKRLAVTLVVVSLAGAARGQSAAPPAPAAAPSSSGSAYDNGTVPPPVQSSLLRDFQQAEAPRPEPVFAVVGGKLVTGRTRPSVFLPGGVMVLRDAGFLCVGPYRPAELGGTDVRLQCSDGVHYHLVMQSFTDDAGFGRAVRGGPDASVCYGFRAKYAADHLVAPKGYQLRADGEQLMLLRGAS